MGAEARLRPGCNAVRDFPGPIREERRPTSRNTVRGGALASNFKRSLVSACKEARISYGRKVKGGFTFHDLRHAFNTYMRKAGVAEVGDYADHRALNTGDVRPVQHGGRGRCKGRHYPMAGIPRKWSPKRSPRSSKGLGPCDLTPRFSWSGRLDLNQRLQRPERSALPD